ncbi:hypothetical protein APHAL10511_004301 [Amanita phalloides]|nr:hypothetical protein APHAL10511_004301 [Amanita phalloides]
MRLLLLLFIAFLPLGSFADSLAVGWARHSWHKHAHHKHAHHKPAHHKPAHHKPAHHKTVHHKSAHHKLAHHKPARYNPAQYIHTHKGATNYTLQDYYAGKSFLDDWWYFSGNDPTNGNVNYLKKEEAVDKKLSYVQPGGATVLAVDNYSNIPVGGKRNSVRIQTKKTYSSGLFIADFSAMPYGCSVWPAYWSVGNPWPNAGEIDIIEGVNLGPANQYTLHSAADSTCTLTTAGTEVLSNVMHDVCASSDKDNRGCGFHDNNSSSYGQVFNNGGGGIFAHRWDSTGITIWRFNRDNIPSDITARQPNPVTWPTPVAFWSSESCDIAANFYNHVLVLDTTVCGGWAGAAYDKSGCPGTCAEAVANNANFDTAKWIINYIAVYQLE